MKKSMSCTINNATIDMKNMTVTEVIKDEEFVYDLEKILKEWDQVEGISIAIKKDSKVTSDE